MAGPAATVRKLYTVLNADGRWGGQTLTIILSDNAATALSKSDAFGHLKVIPADDGA